MRKHVKRVFILLIIISFLASVLVILGAVVLYRFSKSRLNDEVLEAVRSYQKTEFYRFERDDEGCIMNSPISMNYPSENRSFSKEYVTFDKIPENLKNAFIAIEDKRFYKHSGIDYVRSISAVINYLTSGSKSFGGSTITQQLVKNLTGNDRKLIDRKLTEAFSAMDLERRYDKSEIFEAYINIINLSRGCIGIGDASHYYFSKDVSDLDLCESASLAAITNNPSKYDPISHPDENKKRRDIILHCMAEMQFISQEEYKNAIIQELNLNVDQENRGRGTDSWYIEAVIEDVISDLSIKYNVDKKTASLLFYKGGYKIYTAMDQDIQSCLESFYNDIDNFPIDSDGKTPQSSMIVIDPYSGDILGTVGGVGEKKGNRLLNYATDSKRPSGSAIKPLSVYAPAFEKGLIKWSTIIDDSPVVEGSGTSSPWPLNANRQYLGNVTIDHAIKNSLNTVPVKLLRVLGNEVSFKFLHNSLRISSLNQKRDTGDASLALGQHSIGITLRELVSAYSIFTDGIMKKSRTYYKVTDQNGRIILDNSSDEERVISRENAAIMTKLLENVIKDGTASSLITLNEITEVAGKTGTTQFNFDRYFIGYTPTLLAGVWQGYEMPKSLDFIGSNYSALIWDQVMKDIYNISDKYKRKTFFEIPDTVQKLSYQYYLDTVNEDRNPDLIYDEGWFDIRQK